MAKKTIIKSAADMSRNRDLAGQTVSKNGFNITYDDQGYAVSASNYNHPTVQGTDRGVAAKSADAVLSGGSRGSSGGSSYDRSYLSDQDLAALSSAGAAWTAASKAGDQTGMAAAHADAEAIRSKYGYSGGGDGSGYIQLGYRQFNPDAGGGRSGGSSGGGSVRSGGGEFSYASAPQYVNRYQSQIDDLTAQILGREAFSYDPEQDPAFQQYRESYTRGGERAMRDTLAQLAARTGGLASSYAGSAAQQTYDNYMSALSDKLPELRQLAYSMYQDEGTQLRDNLGMLASLEQGDYAKFADRLAQYNTDRSFDYGAYRDRVGDQRYQTEWNYQAGRDQLADRRYDDETAYNREQDAWQRASYASETEYNQALEKAQLLASAGDFSGYRALGYSDQEISSLTNAYNAAQLLARRSGGSSSGGRGSGSSAAESGGNKWDGVENWVSLYGSGAAEDYIKENYKELGYSSQSAALSGWRNHLLERGGGQSGGRTSLDYDEDEGVFTWNGRRYASMEQLNDALNRADLTGPEEEALKRKLDLFGFSA